MDIREVTSVADIILTGVAEKPDAEMLVIGDERITWAEMRDRAGQVANALRASGVGPQERIAYIDKNGAEYFELAFGCSLANSVTVAVNWRLAPPEMAYIVNDAQSKVLVIHEEFADHLAAFEADLTHTDTILVIGDHDTHASYAGWRDAHTPDCEITPAGGDDVSMQLYTSGTTGLPKGAQLTNDNFKTLFQVVEWQMDDDSVNMAVMPLFHIAGSGWALFGMGCGARTIMTREFEPVSALQLIESEAITHAIFVPAILQFFLMVPSDGVDLSTMELIVYGASPITQDVLVKSMEMFGCQYMQVYGLTETTGAVTQLDPEDHDPGGPREHLLRSAGKPIASVEVKIVDADTGASLPDGEVGEVWIRSLQNMKGYWNMPEETAASMPGDGWFRSGDAAYMEDGFLFIHDRVKDMIISGGENVYPAEIENALMAHEGIADVAVIGIPDDKWGEVGKALVIPVPDGGVTAEEILAFARERLAGFKCPKTVDFVEAIPRNPSGKIIKRELRDPYWEGRDRRVN
ncbi:MAG: long-chain-fatty-acid--CoA ligase [Acidimicrobiales bacterium]|nr:long-chain-fatty-acid--CoA ligase [Acidimicrobiales bacterium]